MISFQAVLKQLAASVATSPSCAACEKPYVREPSLNLYTEVLIHRP
jgi:hypothetical protein